MLKKSIVALQTEIATLRKERTDKNRKLKKKLSEIVPSGEGISSDDEASEKSSKSDNNSSTVDQPQHSQGPKPREGEMDVALNELEKLKSYVNNVELQLYEANEKISELQESVSIKPESHISISRATQQVLSWNVSSIAEATIRGDNRQVACRKGRVQ